MHQQLVLAMNTTTEAHATISELGGTVFSEVFQELIIISITLICAVVFKGYPFFRSDGKKGTSSHKVSKKMPPTPRPVSMTPTPCVRMPPPPGLTLASTDVAAAPFACCEAGAAVQHPWTKRPSRTSGDLEEAAVICEIVRSANGTRPAEEVFALYEQMRAKGGHIKDYIKQSGHSILELYGALIRVAGRTGKPELLEKLLDDMALAGIARPRGVYESVMKLLAGKGHYREALAVYERMQTDGIEPTSVTLSCLSNFAAELGELDLALSFFERLSLQGAPTIRACMTALRVHAKRQDWPKSAEIFRDMHRRGVTMDSLVLNIVLSTGVAAGELDEAKVLLHEAQGIEPPVSDVVSYNTIIKGCAQQGDCDKALELLGWMNERKVMPNAITYNTTMDAAVRGARGDDAWNLLAKMRKDGIHPDKFTCSILVKSLSDGATSEQVDRILEMMTCVRDDCGLLGNLFRGVLEAAARLKDTPLLMRTFAQMRKQRVALSESVQGTSEEKTHGSKRLRGRPGRPFRAGAMLRLPLGACVQSGRLDDGVNLIKEALELGISFPPEAIEQFAEAAVRRRQSCTAFDRLREIAEKHGLQLLRAPAGG